MSDLCAPLQSLYDEYQRLVDEVHRDPSLAPTASARLADLTTTDAAGYVWALNESGSWFRAQPGQSYEPADPALFAIPPSPSTPVLAPSPGILDTAAVAEPESFTFGSATRSTDGILSHLLHPERVRTSLTPPQPHHRGVRFGRGREEFSSSSPPWP